MSARVATGADLDGVLAVQRAAGRAASDGFQAATAASIDDPERCVVVVTDGEIVIGWATTWYFPEPAAAAPAGHYLMGITVHPDHRRRGLARALTAARLDWIGERDTTAHSFTNARNTASIALHAGFGFQEVARGAAFRGVGFEGGEGILFSATLG